MDTGSQRILAAAEELFDRNGYCATGMDRLTAAAGVSSRTLYKHAGSKADLMAAVLAARHRRFMRGVDVSGVSALFVALEHWLRAEGARGCLFLRAYGETGGDIAGIAKMVLAHKAAVRATVESIVASELDGRDDPALAEQIMILFEGATAAAVYRGPQAAAAARSAATALVAQART